MKGFVVTPSSVVDLMVAKLFHTVPPVRGAQVLDPGAGRGAFIDGILRWCQINSVELPQIVGIESDAGNAEYLRRRFSGNSQIEIREVDFLLRSSEQFDYVIGNPPYVAITRLTPIEREQYRRNFLTATNRFDLYLLFFEQALRLLKPDGRLVFITPEKFLYVQTAAPLRRILSALDCEELQFVDEATFSDLITYPLISTVANRKASGLTRIWKRDGTSQTICLPESGESWLPTLQGSGTEGDGLTLSQVSIRVSCGVATGADAVFVRRTSDLDPDLLKFAHPTISGRQLVAGESPKVLDSLLIPYDTSGHLLAERHLGAFGEYLRRSAIKKRLLERTCVLRKPWYAFHETPPMRDVLRPKLLCKDIGAAPFFAVDRTGKIIPRHSVYYIVPKDPALLDDLADYLNSLAAQEWLRDHCQRAANNFLRLQSHVLKKLPLPKRFTQASVVQASEETAVQHSLL